MDQVVVIWRDVTTGDHDDLKRHFSWEFRLCMETCNVSIVSDEPPAEFNQTICAKITAIGQELIRALHGIPGVNAANFSSGYMVTIVVFNKMHGIFSWEAGIHRSIKAAFREAARKAGLEVVLVFRKEGDTADEPDEVDAAALEAMLDDTSGS